MNCECFYVVKGGTIEDARKLVDTINKTAEKREEEIYPVYISKAKKSFLASTNYDGFYHHPRYRVKEGDLLVFAQGKDYCMYRTRMTGGKRGFPVYEIKGDFYENFYDYIEDIEEV